MQCNSCKNEYINISGLKFCPYCGEKIEEKKDLEDRQVPNETFNRNTENIAESESKDKKQQDTSAMPVISKKDIRKYNRDKFFAWVKKTFIHRKFIIPIIALFAIITIGVFAYSFLIAKPVDEVRIRENLMGQIVTLPKGTNITITKDNMKKFTVNNRNLSDNKEQIKVGITLNNGSLEAKVSLALVYINESKNKWEISGKPVLVGVTSVKPVAGMNESKFLAELKKLTITIAGTPEILGGQDIKNLTINLRTPNLQNSKEEILVTTSIDSGLLAANGKVKCMLVFENEAWSIKSIEANGSDDFKLSLSPAFSNEKVVENIRKQQLEETVSYSNFFGGKGFTVKDDFTKSINISDKKYDAQKGRLNVTAKRENVAGEIKSVLSTNYTFSISLSNISLINGSKTTVDSGVISDVPTSLIIPSLVNGEIEGSNLLFWWSNNHKITAEEAKTFKTDKILSTKGLQNIKYVYGNITYKDDKQNNNKDRSVSIVAIYFLVYDNTDGYNWTLNKLISEDSPNYKTYSNLVNGK